MGSISRRRFVGRSTAVAAGLGGMSWAAPALAAGDSAGETVVLALMGAGGRGMDVAVKLAQLPGVRFKYVCDVEESRREGGAASLGKQTTTPSPKPVAVADLRRVLDDADVHGVVIGTPEQWHALGTVRACQAGKDVYVEKNISRTIWEGRKMIQAARKYKRVVQAGTQNRSWPCAASARQYIREGGLGKVLHVQVFGMLDSTYGGYPMPQVPDSDPPKGLDWDAWLGPAPWRPYNRQMHRNWYGYWDYSGGNGSDAIHTLDLARHALGDPPPPRRVLCAGGRYQFHDGGQMPDVQIVTYQFDAMVMSFFNTGFTPYNAKSPAEVRFGKKYPYWPQNADRIEIFGSKRMMYLARHGGGWQVFEGGNKLVQQDKAPHPDQWHLPNFVESIRTRKDPNGVIEQGHHSACLEHLANVAYRSGAGCLEFDAKTERFVGNDLANKIAAPHFRGDYRIDEKV